MRGSASAATVFRDPRALCLGRGFFLVQSASPCHLRSVLRRLVHALSFGCSCSRQRAALLHLRSFGPRVFASATSHRRSRIRRAWVGFRSQTTLELPSAPSDMPTDQFASCTSTAIEEDTMGTLGSGISPRGLLRRPSLSVSCSGLCEVGVDDRMDRLRFGLPNHCSTRIKRLSVDFGCCPCRRLPFGCLCIIDPSPDS